MQSSNYDATLSSHDIFSDYSLLIDSMVDWKKRLFSELPFFSFYLKKHKIRTLLDIDCGSGRYVLGMLPQLQYAVGIDSNPFLIEKALKRNTIGTNVSFLNFPIEQLPEQIRKEHLYSKYDCIISLTNSFAGIINDHNLVKRLLLIKEHLNPHGVVIINSFNYNALLKHQEHNFKRIPFRYLDHTYHLVRNLKILEIDLIKYSADLYDEKGHVVASFEQLQRPLTKKRLHIFLEEAGFRVEDVFGDFEFNDFHVDSSKKMITIARPLNSEELKERKKKELNHFREKNN